MRPPVTIEDKLADLLAAHARIVVFGGPETGKTTLCERMVDDRPLISTDEYKDVQWADVPGLIVRRCEGLASYVVEGVRALGAIREGLAVDAVLYLSIPKADLAPKQRPMAQACATKFARWLSTRPSAVVVTEEP